MLRVAITSFTLLPGARRSGPPTRVPRAHASALPFRLRANQDGFVGPARFCEWAESGDASLELQVQRLVELGGRRLLLALQPV